MLWWTVQDLFDERVSWITAVHRTDKGSLGLDVVRRICSRGVLKQLARWGVRLNTRETERKRKRKDDDRSSSSVTRSAKARTGKASDSDDS